jgi:hypothetical protein
MFESPRKGRIQAPIPSLPESKNLRTNATRPNTWSTGVETVVSGEYGEGGRVQTPGIGHPDFAHIQRRLAHKRGVVTGEGGGRRGHLTAVAVAVGAVVVAVCGPSLDLGWNNCNRRAASVASWARRAAVVTGGGGQRRVSASESRLCPATGGSHV